MSIGARHAWIKGMPHWPADVGGIVAAYDAQTFAEKLANMLDGVSHEITLQADTGSGAPMLVICRENDRTRFYCRLLFDQWDHTQRADDISFDTLAEALDMGNLKVLFPHCPLADSTRKHWLAFKRQIDAMIVKAELPYDPPAHTNIDEDGTHMAAWAWGFVGEDNAFDPEPTWLDLARIIHIASHDVHGPAT